MNGLLRSYLKQFETTELEVANKLVSMSNNRELDLLTYGLRAAGLTLKEQMTVFLLAYGYETPEIAKYRGVSDEAVYNMVRKIKAKVNVEEGTSNTSDRG